MSYPCSSLDLTNDFRPISTYGGKGVAEPSIVKAHHAIIYTTAEVPALLPGEGPTRVGSTVDSIRRAIKVKPYDRAQKLDDRSRLNLAKIYQISHAGCEVDVFGAVADDCKSSFLYQFEAVQQSLRPSFQETNFSTAVSMLQAHDESGRSGPSRGRANSAPPSTSQEALNTAVGEGDHKINGETEDTHSSSPQYTPATSAPGASADALTQRLARLTLRAQHLGASLTHMNDQQRAYLGQLPDPAQVRSILRILQQQDPQRHAQVVLSLQQRQAVASAACRTNNDSSEESEDDSDDDSDLSE